MKDSVFISKKWLIIEVVVGIIITLYFLFYPRMAASDFVFCSVATLFLYWSREKLGLEEPSLRVWGNADNLLLGITLSCFLAAWCYGWWQGRLTWSNTFDAMLIILTYFYYGFIQHFLAQRYLAIRMYQFSKKRVGVGALLTGLAFGILHIQEWHLIIPSTIGGVLFAYYYLYTGRFWMVVFAHAMISSTLIYWFFGNNPFRSIVALWNG